MKHRGNVCQFHEERERAVLKAFLAFKKYVPSKEMCGMIGRSPSPRFWISEERAAIIFSKCRDGWDMCGVLPLRKEMYRELYKRMISILDGGTASTTYEAACIAVRQTAPSFYLSSSSIGAILNDALRKNSKWKT